MIFSAQESGTPWFALLFACPYIMHNGVNVALGVNKAITAKDAYAYLYNGRSLSANAEYGNYSINATCNSPAGGEAAGICVVNQSHSSKVVI